MPVEEATINPDGTFEDVPPPTDDPFTNTEPPPIEEDIPIDPALYLLAAVAAIVAIYFLFFRKSANDDEDSFFSELDGQKFNLKLPAEVQEYYQIKAKAEAAGWEPGKPPKNPQQATGPHRMLAQALMKRAMADIPMVQHIQKESSGMNKLYSQSMCSVKQWRSYQQAETLVSTEVDEVRAEADEIEPGWSQAIWRQAMQYHTMLQKKHEAEEKARQEAAAKRKEIESRVAAHQNQPTKEDQEKAAERAAAELLQEEEEEKQQQKGGKKATASGMKKGFLQKGKKK